MYSFSQILKQEPAAIVSTLTILNSMLIAFHAYSMDDTQLSLVHAFAFSLLTLFYIRPLTASKDALNELSTINPPMLYTPAKQSDAA